MKSSGIILPEVHGIGKSLDLNIQSDKQVIMPVTVTEVKEVTEIKPRVGQGRAGLRCKIKSPVNRPIVETIENPLKSLKYLKYKTKSQLHPIMQFHI